MENKQTAVEWFDIESRKLYRRIENKEISIGEFSVSYHELFNQAKEIQREQIEEAYNQGDKDSMLWHSEHDIEFNDSSDYFTKTYKDGKESK